jgi:hypothetical protein
MGVIIEAGPELSGEVAIGAYVGSSARQENGKAEAASIYSFLLVKGGALMGYGRTEARLGRD